MNPKYVLTIVIVLTIAVSVFAFGSQSQLTKNLFGFERRIDAQAANQIPNHVLYDKLFRMIISFNKKAESQEMSAEKRIGLTSYFKNRAKLTDEEDKILQQTAIEYIQEVVPIDAQARTVIAQTRQVNSNGVVPRKQPPPAELANLQEQRDALVLRYREQLKESLGADGFAKFDEFINGSFASRFQAIPLSSVNFDQEQ